MTPYRMAYPERLRLQQLTVGLRLFFSEDAVGIPGIG